MPATIKVLGQAAPAANTWTPLYTCPTGGSAVISGFTVTNTGATAARFSLAIRVAGAALTTAHYLYAAVEIAPNDTFAGPSGITISAADIVTVCATATGIAFNLFGEETTP